MEVTRRDRFDPDFVVAILPAVLVVLLVAVAKWRMEEISSVPATVSDAATGFDPAGQLGVLVFGFSWTAWGGVAVAVVVLLIVDRSRRGFGALAARRPSASPTAPRRILRLRPVRAISRVARWRERPGIVETSLAFVLPILLAVFAWGAFRLTVSPGDRPCAVPVKRYTAF